MPIADNLVLLLLSDFTPGVTRHNFNPLYMKFPKIKGLPKVIYEYQYGYCGIEKSSNLIQLIRVCFQIRCTEIKAISEN